MHNLFKVSMAFSFRMGCSTVCNILTETFKAIWQALTPEYVMTPAGESEWKGISSQFKKSWNFSHCVGK